MITIAGESVFKYVSQYQEEKKNFNTLNRFFMI